MDKKDRKRQYNKETYEWLKEHHLCTRCKKQDSYTLIGRAICYECALKRREYGKKRYRDNVKKNPDYNKERYNNYKKQRICTTCHKRQAQEGHIECSVCLGKHKKYYYEHKVKSCDREDAIANGMCYTCLKEKVKPGYKVCERCYENLVKASQKADNSYFRKTNDLFFIKNY